VSQDHSKDRYRGIPLPYLKEVRQSRGLSQRGLGELSGVSSGTVFQVETGLRGGVPRYGEEVTYGFRSSPRRVGPWEEYLMIRGHRGSAPIKPSPNALPRTS
jgi:DNA-binding XRE family transcriptional regulator